MRRRLFHTHCISMMISVALRLFVSQTLSYTSHLHNTVCGATSVCVADFHSHLTSHSHVYVCGATSDCVAYTYTPTASARYVRGAAFVCVADFHSSHLHVYVCGAASDCVLPSHIHHICMCMSVALRLFASQTFLIHITSE